MQLNYAGIRYDDLSKPQHDRLLNLVDYHVARGISTDGAALIAARRYLLRKYRHRLRRHHVA